MGVARGHAERRGIKALLLKEAKLFAGKCMVVPKYYIIVPNYCIALLKYCIAAFCFGNKSFASVKCKTFAWRSPS
jgi:hypothetical protein